jgi:hypothetical protein
MPDIQIGDLVWLKVPVSVTWVDDDGTIFFGQPPSGFTANDVAMVRRAPRTPKVGDELTPRDISRKQLPLGTVLQSLVDEKTRLVLLRDKTYGESWEEPKSNLSYTSSEMLDYEFEDNRDRQIWRIAYLP